MTQQEWENASEEERNIEIDRCRTDTHYFYMTYYWKEGMRKYTKDEFDGIQGFMVTGGRRVRRFNPLAEQAKVIEKLPDFIKPTKRSYDGNEMRTNWEYDPEEPFPIPISLALSDPEKYAELVERRRKMFEEMWEGFSPIIRDKTIGKATLLSTVELGDKQDFRSIWGESDWLKEYRRKYGFQIRWR